MNPINKLLNWYFSKKSLPYWCIFLLDFFLLMLAGILTYWIFVYRQKITFDQSKLLQTLFVYALPSIVGARMFHTYAGIIRYSSFVDLTNLHFRNICQMYLIGTLLMWLVRVLVKTIYEVINKDIRAQRVLVYGSMDGCIGLAKYVRSQTPRRFVIKGFISEDTSYKNNLIMGEKVYNPLDDILKIVDRSGISAILVAPQNIKEFRDDQELQDKLINAGVKIFMSQNVKELDVKDGELQEEIQIKEVSVEDLLPRDEIQVDMKSMGELLSDQRVLITGAAGSIGSELVRQIATYKPEAMMLIDQAETPEHDIRLMMSREFPDVLAETVVTSICKEERMEKIFSEFRPDYVFHAAAYKHVPMMENNPSEAVQNNIYGTKVIADLADKYGVKKFVMVSTDKAVNPTNVMGCSKRICEIYVQALSKKSKTQFVTTRFGNVLGSNGSVIPLFNKQIKHGGPVTVTDQRIVRYFMLIPEACKLVLEAGTKGHGGEIFVFDMGKPVKIADLAERMIRLSGAKNVKIEYTGLREGEKLYEEVLNDKENTKPTFHKKIRIAEVREYDYEEVSRQINELIELSKQYDDMATVKKMKEIVPEYKSNNSKYEKLDNNA